MKTYLSVIVTIILIGGTIPLMSVTFMMLNTANDFIVIAGMLTLVLIPVLVVHALYRIWQHPIAACIQKIRHRLENV